METNYYYHTVKLTDQQKRDYYIGLSKEELVERLIGVEKVCENMTAIDINTIPDGGWPNITISSSVDGLVAKYCDPAKAAIL